MPLRKILTIFVVTCIFFGCSIKKQPLVFVNTQNEFAKKQKISREKFKTWYHKDIVEDSIFGISLDRAYRDLLKGKQNTEVIVAVIDGELKKNHAELRNRIWINKNEIPNNNIDDDNNGYIDDINGWNYIGTTLNDSIPYHSYSYTRFVKKHKSKFENKLTENFTEIDKTIYKEYKKALYDHNKQIEYINGRIIFYNKVKKEIQQAKLSLKKYFPDNNFSLLKLDSLNKISNDSLLKLHIKNLKYYNSYEVDIDWANNKLIDAKNRLRTSLNLDFKERIEPDEIFGNNDINGTGEIEHGTKVTGLIVANRDNGSDIKGITNSVKIMSLGITSYGDVYENDLANAIVYAVNNGAKVINMSLSYDFAINKNLVYDAIIYANKKDVLLITSSGNSSRNLDINLNYPTDSSNGEEFVKNFMKIGGTNHFLDTKLVGYFSNYGKKEVDIFAPSERIYCITREKNIFHYGTSYASAIVSGIASLIRSYYPNLTAAEVKQIIMESGVSYDIMVNKPSESEEKELVPFSSLSKSGKIVNAYNALLMAEEISKNKN